MTRIRAVLIGMFISLSLLGAAYTAAADDQAAQAQQRLAAAKERLDLSDEQLDQLAPVLEKSMAAQRRVLASYGIDLENRNGAGNRPGLRQARAMRKEMNAVKSDTLAEVNKILTDAQLKEFKRMQEERQAEMRQRIRGARS